MVRNLTSKKIISKDIKLANNFFDKTLGMILKKNSHGIILKTGFGIHTFFLKKPIDIAIVNRQNEVVLIRENLLPGRIFVWNPKFDTVVELPQGLIKKSETKVGDKLDL